MSVQVPVFMPGQALPVEFDDEEETNARMARTKARRQVYKNRRWERSYTKEIPGITQAERLAMLKEMEHAYKNPAPPFPPDFFQHAAREGRELREQLFQQRRAAAHRDLYGDPRPISPPRTRENSPARDMMNQTRTLSPEPQNGQQEPFPQTTENSLPQPLQSQSSTQDPMPQQPSLQHDRWAQPLASTAQRRLGPHEQVGSSQDTFPTSSHQRFVPSGALPQPNRKSSAAKTLQVKDSKVVKRTYPSRKTTKVDPSDLFELDFSGKNAQRQNFNRAKSSCKHEGL